MWSRSSEGRADGTGEYTRLQGQPRWTMMLPCQLPGPHLDSLHSLTCAVCLRSCLQSASGDAVEWLMASLAASKGTVHDCVCHMTACVSSAMWLGCAQWSTIWSHMILTALGMAWVLNSTPPDAALRGARLGSSTGAWPLGSTGRSTACCVHQLQRMCLSTAVIRSTQVSMGGDAHTCSCSQKKPSHV